MGMDLHFYVGNDNGNSEHVLLINGKLIQQPNVYIEVDELPFDDSAEPSTYIRNLEDQLIVTVDSPSARVGMYYVGNLALNSGEPVRNIQVGVDRKYELDLPIINTLAHIASQGVIKAYEDTKEVPSELSVTVDMATALPVNQFTKETAEKFEKRFMDHEHHVTVHLGTYRVRVKISFEFVKVIPEATPVTFALQMTEEGQWRKGDIFDEFCKLYNLPEVTGKYFKDKRMLHVDIGEGTTEYAVTEGNIFIREFTRGKNYGVGYAIESALDAFNESINLPDSPAQYFSKVLKNPEEYKKIYPKALDAIKTHLEKQVNLVYRETVKQLNRTRNEIDVICVYGGGSILMKPTLYPLLLKLAQEREIQLLYIPKKHAVVLNAEGLNIFVRSPIYKNLKEVALQSN